MVVGGPGHAARPLQWMLWGALPVPSWDTMTVSPTWIVHADGMALFVEVTTE